MSRRNRWLAASGLALGLALGAGTALGAPALLGTGAFVGGGSGNTADGNYAVAVGGLNNAANGAADAIGGGNANVASGFESTIAGGFHNTVTDYAAIGGGFNNTANATFAVVGGGKGNLATGNAATVGGGTANAAGGAYTTIAGGGPSDGASAATANRATDDYATVAGGGNNQAGSADGDATNATYAAVGGGKANLAAAYASTVAGGVNNKATRGYATVGGGNGNAASGVGATVPGGVSNAATGGYSLAAGRRAKANDAGAFVWADSTDVDFFSTAPNEFAARATGGFRLVTAVNGSGGATAGASLAAGSGSWSTLSDRNLKANFQAVDGRDVLQRLVALPVSTWNYRAQGAGVRHLGPTAQDFRAAFGLGEDETTISVVDEQGVALAAIQGLYATTQAQNTQLRAANETLAQQISALQVDVASLKQREGIAPAPPATLPELPTSWALVLGLGLGGLGLGLGLRCGRR